MSWETMYINYKHELPKIIKLYVLYEKRETKMDYLLVVSVSKIQFNTEITKPHIYQHISYLTFIYFWEILINTTINFRINLQKSYFRIMK